MKKTKNTFIALGIIIIVVGILAFLNTFLYKRDPFKDFHNIKESAILSIDSNKYYVYFYQLDNERCDDLNDIMTKKLAGNLFYCNLDNTDEHFVKFGKDYSLEDTDFTQWRELEDITITKTPALLTVQDGKIINYTEDCNEIKEYAES